MSGTFEDAPISSEHDRPSWSVFAGEFDPDSPKLNDVLVATMALQFRDAPKGSKWRLYYQSRELVLQAYEICGTDSSAIGLQMADDMLEPLKDYVEQQRLTKLTPELDIPKPSDTADEPQQISASPVMDALRVLINLSNSVDSIVLDDMVRTEKEKWEVDGDTRRLAEAILRSFCIREKMLGQTGAVE